MIIDYTTLMNQILFLLTPCEEIIISEWECGMLKSTKCSPMIEPSIRVQFQSQSLVR